MINVKQINCNGATFVDKYHATAVFSKNSTLTAGIVRNRSIGVNIYKTILSFNLSDLKPDIVESATLYLFVENIQYTDTSFKNIGICGNYEHVNTKTLNWNTFPMEGSTEMLRLTIPKNSNGAYIKINITAIMKELAKYDVNYNFIFAPINITSNMIVKFASFNTKNPPYIRLELNDDDSFRQIKKDTSSIDKGPDEMIKITHQAPNRIEDDKYINKKDIISNKEVDTEHEDNMPETNMRRYDSFTNYTNSNNRELDIPTLFTEISDTLEHQSELLNNIKNSDKGSIYQNMFVDINNKFESFNNEFSNLRQEISLKSSTKDIDLTNAMIIKLSQKLDMQSSVINSISDLTSENCTIDDVQKINETVMKLSDNMESLYSVLNEIKEISSASSTSEEIKSLNSLVTLLLNTLDMQGAELSNLQESLQNNADKSDLININSILAELDTKFENTNSLLDNIKTDINKTCSSQDLMQTNDFINNLSENLISIHDSVNVINKITSNIPTTDNLQTVIDSITDVKNIINQEQSKINNLQENLTNILSKEDINGTNTLIVNLNKAIDVQNNTFNSLKNSFSNFMDDMNSRYDSFSSMQKMIDTVNTDIKTAIKDISVSIPNLESIQNKMNDVITVKDLESINNFITSIQKDHEAQMSILFSVKSELVNEIKKNSDMISALNKIVSQNISSCDIQDMVNKALNSSLSKQNELISNINENISKIHNNNDWSSVNENIINVMQLLDNNSLKIKSSNSTNETYYKSISDSLEKLNNKLSNFENLNSKLDLFENSSVVLSQNFLDLNREIVKLKSIVLPISEDLNLLKSDFNAFKDTVLNSQHSSTESVDNTQEINLINDRLSLLSENLQKIMDIISSITIEPLN